LKKPAVLILYSFPAPYFPNGTTDTIGPDSVLSRLHAVQQALASLDYPVQTLEAQGDLPSLLEKIRLAGPQVIFNLCEEFLGQTQLEMHLAALLELLDIPFTGSGAFVLGLSQDKGKTKSILAHEGIPTPAFRVWEPGRDDQLSGLKFPLIIKPLREDGSLGIGLDAFIQEENALRQQVQKIHQSYKQPVLVEEYIEGRELNVSILGNEEPQVLPISEIDFSTMPPGLPRICSYTAKWVEGSQEFANTIPRCPAPLSPLFEKKIKEIALRTYRIIGCRDYARVDIRLSPRGIPYVLEVNANPDISPDAGMPRSAKTAGFSYPEFLAKIIELASVRGASIRSRGKLKAPSARKPHA